MGIQIGGGKGGAIADMNVVPLIDILLVLLIIFMVITPLTPKGLDALVPLPPPKDQQPDPSIQAKLVVVQVGADGSLKINQDVVDWDTLESRLTDIFKTRAERVAFIQGDEGVLFEQVARAIDIMHNSNIDKVGLITTNVAAGE